MKVELNKIDDLNAQLTIQIGSEDYNDRIEKKLKEYRKKVQMPGFRVGMVPMGHIKRLYGKGIKAQEINDMVHHSLVEYLKNDQIKILGDPLINIDKTDKVDDWEVVDKLNFVFDLGLRPTVEVKLTKKNKIQYQKIEITPQSIQDAVDNIKMRYGTLEDVETVGENDMIRCSMIQLDTEGTILENGISTTNTLVRIESIDDQTIRQAIVGKKISDKVVINPKQAFKNTTELSTMLNITQEEVQILESNFELTIEQIKHHTPAQLNTELFEKVYPGQEVTTEEQFRNKLTSEIEQSHHFLHEAKFLNNTIKYLTEKINPTLPEEFLKRWLVDTEKMAPEKVEEVWNDYRRTFQWQLIVEKIASDNEIKINEEDIVEKAKDEVKQAFSYYNMANIPEETLMSLAKSKLEKENQYSRYASIAIESKVLDKIKELASIDEVVVPVDKFNEK